MPEMFCALIKKIFLILLVSHSIQAQSVYDFNFEYDDYALPYGITAKKISGFPKTAIALSGGGARGLSQIGVLRALEENEIYFDQVVGTSMGSIVGGLYSSGYSTAEIESIAVDADWTDFFSTGEAERTELFVDQKITADKAVLTLRLDGLTPVLPTAINTGQRVSVFLNLLALNAPIHVDSSFDELLYDMRAVAADLVTGEKVVLKEGSLGLAMRASSSISLLLSPVWRDSTLLVDGGAVENIPVITSKECGNDLVIAVNATSPLAGIDDLRYPWIIADQIVSIPMKILNEQSLEKASLVIEPELEETANGAFENIPSKVSAGYRAALGKVEEIRKLQEKTFYDSLKSENRWFRNVIVDAPALSSVFPEDRYSNYDSVSAYQIWFDLYRAYKRDGLDNISARMVETSEGFRLEIQGVDNPVVNEIEINGITLIDSSLYVSPFDKLIGKPYSPRATLEAVLSLMRLYRSEGFSLAHPDSVYFDKSAGKLSLSIGEGVISKITLEGNRKTNRKIIEREFPLEEGDFFRYEEVRQGLVNLRATDLFEDVEIGVDKAENSNILKIKVREKTSSLVRLGLRIDDENLTQVSFDVRDENIFGTATEIGAIFSGGSRNRSLIIEHKANRLFDSYLTYKLRAFTQFNDINTYSYDSLETEGRFSRTKTGEYRQIYTGVSIGLGSQVGRFGNMFVELDLTQDEIKNKLDFAGSTYKTNIASLRYSFMIDSQDRYPFPYNGFLAHGYYETGQNALGGEIGYSKFWFDYKIFIPLAEKHNVQPRFTIGFADETLPLSRQFSFGGQNSFFGLRANDSRGRQIFTSSLQYRYMLPFKIFFDAYLKFRYDLGSVWGTREQIRFKDLMHGTGVTLALDTPLGPAEFSIGRAFLIREKFFDSRIVKGDILFYFTIGYYY